MKQRLQSITFSAIKGVLHLGSRLPLVGGVFARFESAWQGWGERSWLQQSLQDARFDIDAATRQELQRRHRYWVSNNPLVQKIRNLFLQFAVGPGGLTVTPNSDDENWNHSRTHAFNLWAREPDLGSRLTLPGCTRQWAGQLFDDGEFFIYKRTLPNGLKAVQTIEAHRICTPSKVKEYRGMSIFDGCVVDANGKTQFYAVRVNQDSSLNGFLDQQGQKNYGEEEFSFVKASAGAKSDGIIHKFKHRRPGQLRGIPEGFSGMNILHDLDDLQKLEMQCAKMAAEIGLTETNPSGELDVLANRKLKTSIQTVNGSGQPVTKNVWADYNVSFGGKKLALKSGDNLQNFMVNRPTVAQQDYYDLLISQICANYNVPVMIAFPHAAAKASGPAIRAELDICSNAFRVNFEIVAEALRELYEWQGEWAKDYDLMQDGACPPDYFACVIRPPRSPNVDIGYTARALQTELELGVKTIQDVYAEKQQDWRVQLRQIAEAVAFTKELAKEFGIDADQITSLAEKQILPPAPGGGTKPEAVEDLEPQEVQA